MTAGSLQILGGVRLLVIANDDGASWRTLLAGSEVEATTLRDADTALKLLETGRMDAVLIAFDLKTAAALEVLSRIRARWELPVLLHAEAGAISADRADALGAAAVVHPAGGAASLLLAVRSSLALSYATDADPTVVHATHEQPALKPRQSPQDILLGDSPAMNRVHELIGKAAKGVATILILGETGTGKELVARAVHATSDRAAGPLVTIVCGALPDNLLESELFGYEKGAFTGADAQKRGRVERADGGTLFLDEIGDVTPAVQVKLLRLLQDRAFQRLGGHQTLTANVRFVAATHRDLEGMVKEGTFREDLFYRLNVVPLWVPPLRARKKDIAMLSVHFCAVFAEANARHGTSLTSEAVEQLTKHRWPGNVRQLQNFIERMVVLSDTRQITAEDIRRELRTGSPFRTEGDLASRSISSSAGEHAVVVRLDEAVATAERKAMVAALASARGNRSQAARLLGISRATFYTKLKQHDLP